MGHGNGVKDTETLIKKLKPTVILTFLCNTQHISNNLLSSLDSFHMSEKS